MRGACPNCEKETEIKEIRAVEDINIRGEVYPTEVSYFKCSECDTEFRDPRAEDDPLDLAYAAYRRQHGMLSPEEIRAFRASYGLTQEELSSLLGWGGATLSRYENGALQDEAHDTLLKLAMEPDNLLDLLSRKPEAVSDVKRGQITDRLINLARASEQSMSSRLEALFGMYAEDEYSGYLRLNITKLLNAMIYFCAGDEVPKTKLNKLLFYSDFKHFKDYALSITGAQYAHLPYGPAPDHYEFYFATLQDEEKAIQVEEREFPGYVGEYLRAIKEPSLAMFSTTELKVLTTIKEQFAALTASAISRRSHEERAYQDTRDGELISYKYAADLSI